MKYKTKFIDEYIFNLYILKKRKISKIMSFLGDFNATTLSVKK